jgi:hypothetical protein
MKNFRDKIGNITAWTLAFGLMGGLVYWSMGSQCMCGHGGMEPFGAAIFAGFAILGLVAGWAVEKNYAFSKGRGVAVAIALMLAGTVAAFALAGNDLDAGHKNMFKPADPSAMRGVEY